MSPQISVGNQVVPANNLMLEPRDVAPILRESLTDLRNRRRRGELRNVSTMRRWLLDPVEVVAVLDAKVAAGEAPHVAYIELARLIRTPPAGSV